MDVLHAVMTLTRTLLLVTKWPPWLLACATLMWGLAVAALLVNTVYNAYRLCRYLQHLVWRCVRALTLAAIVLVVTVTICNAAD